MRHGSLPTAPARAVALELSAAHARAGASALTWLHVLSSASTHAETKSTGNSGEAALAGCMAAVLLEAARREASGRSALPVRVVVLTPYKAQKELLEDAIAHATAQLRPSELDYARAAHWVSSSSLVSTTDAFQGQEADIVIVSTVRSSAPGSS